MRKTPVYIEIDFNLLYQIEKIAQRSGRSVTDVVNEAVAQYVEHNKIEDDSAKPADDAS
jgi:predicted transcriptional regulator